MLEMIFVMALLMLLGVTTISLVISGSKAYSSITAGMTDNTELRIAVSYINMRIRQNDIRDLIRIEKNPINGQNAVVITEKAGSVSYETWIYYDSGILREGYIAAGETVKNDISFKIAKIDGLEIEVKSDYVLSFKVWRSSGESEQSRNQTIMLRTDR